MRKHYTNTASVAMSTNEETLHKQTTFKQEMFVKHQCPVLCNIEKGYALDFSSN
jgi:hypothetical protein